MEKPPQKNLEMTFQFSPKYNEVRAKQISNRIAEALPKLEEYAAPEVIDVVKRLWENDDITELKEMMQQGLEEMGRVVEWAALDNPDLEELNNSVKTLAILVDLILSTRTRL